MILDSQTKRVGETILIACLAIVFSGWVASHTINAKQSAVISNKKAQVMTIAGAVHLYNIEHGEYPAVAAHLPFCEPFAFYKQDQCLGVLVGSYIDKKTIDLSGRTYVYVNDGEEVFVAVDLPLEHGDSVANSCMIGTRTFWCIKLPT